MSSDSKTRYVILIPDGMAGEPTPELDGKTTLESAGTSWMDRVAAAGLTGMTRTVPEGMDAGSDVANLSILGYDPRSVYTGRAPLEAASMGLELGPDDLAFRLNLVTLDRNYTIMSDHSGGHITTGEAEELISLMRDEADYLGLAVYPGVSYRNLLVWPGGPEGCVTYPPHDFPGEPIDVRLPSGPGADVLLTFIIKSWKRFESHVVNQRRARNGQTPANSVWPWGQGKPPQIKTLQELFGISGAVVAAVDLIKGIGKYAGMEALNVPGATGYLDTNYAGKVEAALNALADKDFVFLHVEAPDETGHSGKPDLKIKAIEDFDAKVLGPVLQGLEAFSRWRLLVMPDHRTPVTTRTHSADPVPFLLLDSDQWSAASVNEAPFSERFAETHGPLIADATRMIRIILEREEFPR